MAKRLGSFDVAKAIAIIAVIVGHTSLRYASFSSSASFAIAATFTFHLPVFFFISGYFLHTDRPFSVSKEARSLIFPYAVTSLLIVACICIENMATHAFGSTHDVLNSWLSAAIYGLGDIPSAGVAIWPQTARIGGIWFLFALFWARLAASISFKFKSPVICGVACFSLGLLSARYVMLPFDIQSGLCAAPFVMFGAYARGHKLFERHNFHVIAWPILLSIWCWAVLGYNGFSMAMCAYGETAIDLLRNIAGSIASTVCILGALNSLERNRKTSGRIASAAWKSLSCLGQITVYILCVHIFEDNVVRWNQIVELTHAWSPEYIWIAISAIRIAADIAIATISKGISKSISRRLAKYVSA